MQLHITGALASRLTGLATTSLRSVELGIVWDEISNLHGLIHCTRLSLVARFVR